MGGLTNASTLPQINLYRPPADRVELNPGARVLLYSGVVVCLAVIALAAVGEVYLSGLRSDREMAAQRLSGAEQRLSQATAALRTPTQDPFLEAEQARLAEELANLEAALDVLTRHRSNAQDGFSNVFTGLARQTRDGIWLNRIALSAGGEQLSLGGQAVDPALIPGLLQALSSEQAFRGRSFRDVRFDRPIDRENGVIDFELHSAEAVGGGDAG